MKRYGVARHRTIDVSVVFIYVIFVSVPFRTALTYIHTEGNIIFLETILLHGLLTIFSKGIYDLLFQNLYTPV